MTTLKMTVDEALALADQWCAGLTMHADSKGWGAILLVLAEEVRRLRADAERLDRLDRLNAALNAKYGTIYRWKLVLSPNVVRLMLETAGPGRVAAVDLNDANHDGLPSCRDAIDAAIREHAITEATNAG